MVRSSCLPGNVEEVTPSGSLIKYYTAGGMALGVNTASDASGISYLASDGLGSVSEALNGSGTATGAQLYSPYGGVRYTTGTMPTSKGFTGQYADANSSGLDYYGARYYDPSLGQFTSADTVSDGINRYGYVKGNPETFTDPTGHQLASDGTGGGGSNCTSLLDCLNLDFGGNSSVDRTGHASVGDGQGVSSVRPGATSDYRWCTSNRTCVDAIGYSGKQLRNLIKSDKAHLNDEQTWLARFNDWGNVIAGGSAIVVAIVVTVLVALAEGVGAAGDLAEGAPPPDVSTAIKGALQAGSTAGGWTAVGVEAVLDVAKSVLRSEISDTQARLAQENKAAQSGSTLWQVSSMGGTDEAGMYTVIDGGTVPGNPVKNAVATILSRECATGVGWFNNVHDC